MMNINNIAI